MSVVYEKIVEEDLSVGTGSVTVTAPGGGTMVGTKLNGASTIPELTQTEIDALSPSGIMIVYNSTTQFLNFYNGSAWTQVLTGVL